MIPYTIERRPDTGVNNVTLGVWLSLASEAMLFGALFSAYALLRTGAAAWVDPRAALDVRFGLVHTIVLLGATTCVWRARVAEPPPWLWAGTGLAALFVVLKATEYAGELGRGLRPAQSTFLATYFTFTGLHALHVIGGLLANVWAAARRRGPDGQLRGRVRALWLYWTFVDVIWIVIFVLFYLS